jgi:hypothetical protein
MTDKERQTKAKEMREWRAAKQKQQWKQLSWLLPVEVATSLVTYKRQLMTLHKAKML